MSSVVRRRVRCLIACAFVALALPAFDVAASGPPMVNITRGIRPKVGDPIGCFAASMGRSRAEKYNVAFDFSLQLRAVGRSGLVTAWWDGIDGKSSHDPAEFRDDDAIRDVFVVCLPPGEYTLDSVGIGPWETRLPLALRFRIEPFKTTYIGSFIGYDTTQPDPCTGVLYPIARVVATNRYADADIAASRIRKKMPNPYDTVVAPLVTESRPPLLFTCESHP